MDLVETLEPLVVQEVLELRVSREHLDYLVYLGQLVSLALLVRRVTSAQLAQQEPVAVQDRLVLLVLPVHLAPRARLETRDLWAVPEQLASLELRVRLET